MKKRTVIIMSSVVFALILGIILTYRIYLLQNDPTGFYNMRSTDLIVLTMTYLPEISIILTIIAIFMRKGWGFVFTIASAFTTLVSLAGDLFIKFVRMVDVTGNNIVPPACVPWLNVPVLVICIILFIMKFHIYTLPEEIKIKLKIVNLC